MNTISNPGDYRVAVQEAARVFNRGDFKKALTLFQGLAKLNSKNAKIHETLSRIHLKLNDVSGAEKEFRIAMELYRNHKGYSLELKSFDEIVRDIDNFQTIQRDFEEIMARPVIEEKVSASRTAVHLGIHYMSRGEYDKAEEMLTRFKERLETAFV